MIVKMIQNLGNRMEAWIEKIKETFNKKPRRIKEQTSRDEQNSNRNEKYTGRNQ